MLFMAKTTQLNLSYNNSQTTRTICFPVAGMKYILVHDNQLYVDHNYPRLMAKMVSSAIVMDLKVFFNVLSYIQQQANPYHIRIEFIKPLILHLSIRLQRTSNYGIIFGSCRLMGLTIYV